MSTSERRKSCSPVILVAAAYCFIVALLLISSRGIPYGLDGNETFSDSVHAKNLNQYSLSRSFGLTDESYGTTEAAHPFIHSHQGNFPRFFTAFIYYFGAHSVEAQVIVTALSVGLASVLLAFTFLRRSVNTLFAVICCFVLLTDYFLFLQWHLNTYRVWHCFFFFSSLLCVRSVVFRPTRPSYLLAVANFCLLCYWEYVFASFVLATCAIYSVLIGRGRLKQAFLAVSAEITGGALAFAALAAQLLAYSGLRGVLTDLEYTLHARNSAVDQGFAAKVEAFYSDHNILFWPNYNDASRLRHWTSFFDSLLTHHFQFYSPWLMFGAITTVAALALGLTLTQCRPGAGAVESVGDQTAPQNRIEKALAIVAALSLPILAHLVQPRAIGPSAAPFSMLGAGLGAVAAAGLLYFVWLTLQHRGAASSMRWSSIAKFGILCLGAAALMFFQGRLYGHREEPVWDQAGLLRGWKVTALLVGLSFVCLNLILRGARVAMGSARASEIVRCWPLFAATFLAYGLSYVVFTGYMYSGYLDRQNPFLVFISDIFLGSFLYIILATLIQSMSSESAANALQWPLSSGRTFGPFLSSAALFLLVACLWLSLQRQYYKAVPLDRFSFITKLAAAPYKGHSFVVNTYAAPVAVETGSWAYMDPVFFSRGVSLTSHGFSLEHGETYEWLADRRKNPAYLKPDFALAIRPTSWSDSLDTFVKERTAAGVAPSSEMTMNPLVREASEPFSQFLHLRLLDDDSDILKRRYSIIKLDWDFPGFLLTLPVDEEKVSEALQVTGAQRWIVQLEARSASTSPYVARPVTVLALKTESGAPLRPDEVIRDLTWEFPSDSAPRHGPGISNLSGDGRLVAILSGRSLHIECKTGPGEGLLAVRINDHEALLDLSAPSAGIRSYDFEATDLGGAFPGRAVPLPGQFSTLGTSGSNLEIGYRFIQQEGQAECNSLVVVAQESNLGRWNVRHAYSSIGSDGGVLDIFRYRADHPETVLAYLKDLRAGDSRTYLQWLDDRLGDRALRLDRSPSTGGPPGKESSSAPNSRHPGHLVIPAEPPGEFGTMAYVFPGTRTKLGPAYPTNLVSAPEIDPTYGALRIRFRATPSQLASEQPLFSCGTDGSGSILSISYIGGNLVRLVFTNGGSTRFISPPLPFAFDATHTVEISEGSLYPPNDQASGSLPRSAPILLTSKLSVHLDGASIFDLPYNGPAVPWRTVQVGRLAWAANGIAPVFGGKLEHAERFWPQVGTAGTQDPATPRAAFGKLVLELLFPPASFGRSEPLVTTGVTGAGDLIYVVYVDPTHARVGFDHWGIRGVLGQPFPVDYAKPHKLVISMGSLFPPDGDRFWASYDSSAIDALKKSVIVEIDGQTVLRVASDCYESPASNVTVTENDIGGSTTGPTFGGKILSYKREQLQIRAEPNSGEKNE